MTVDDGALGVTGSIDISGTGGLGLKAVGAGKGMNIIGTLAINSGPVQLSAEGNIVIAGRVESSNGGDVSISAGGDLTVTTLVAAGDDLSLDASGTTTISMGGAIQAGRGIVIGEIRAGGVNLAGTILAGSGAVAFQRGVTLVGDANIFTDNGEIRFEESVVLSGYRLTMNAGPMGDISFGKDVDGGGTILVRDGRVMTVAGVNADTIDINLTGRLIQQGRVVARDVTYAAGQGIEVQSTIAATDGIQIRSNGIVFLGANLFTVDADIVVNADLVLTSDVVLDTTGSFGGSIELNGAVETGGHNLTLDAGLVGDIQANQSITGGGNLLVRGGNAQSYASIIVDTFTVLEAGSSVLLGGDVSLSGVLAIGIRGSLVQNGNVRASSVAYTALGGITINGSVFSTGDIRIETQADLILNNSGGDVDLVVGAGAAITFQAAGSIFLNEDVTVKATHGAVELFANTSAGRTGGAIVMHDRALIDAGSGAILLQADGNITIGGLRTTNSGDPAVRLISRSGTVIDGGDYYLDVDATGRLVLDTAGSVDPSKPLNVKQVISAQRVIIAAIQNQIRTTDVRATVRITILAVLEISRDPLALVQGRINLWALAVVPETLQARSTESPSIAAVRFAPKPLSVRPVSRIGFATRDDGFLFIRIESSIPVGPESEELLQLRGFTLF
ncbi:MAG: hypothetical protein ABMA26_25595 [Limisphaerales bacterium]